MPSLDGHTLIRRGDGLGDLDIAIGGHEVHILGGTDLALDGNRILRIEGNLSLGGGDVALGSDVTPGLDGQVALGADIAVLDNLHILAGNKLATSVVSRNRALDNQVALGGGDCNSIGADSAIECRIVLCGDGHVASMGSELREGCVTARIDGDVAVVRDDVAAHRHIMPGLDGDVASGCRHGYLGLSGHAAVQRGYGDILAAEALRIALAKADIIESKNREVAARGDAVSVEADGIQGGEFDIAGGGDFTIVP